MADAGIRYSDIEQACVGYVYGKMITSLHFHSPNELLWIVSFLSFHHYKSASFHLHLLTLGSYRGLHMWAEGHLSQPGPHRDPHYQRQQQLFHRIHSSLHGPTVNPGW